MENVKEIFEQFKEVVLDNALTDAQAREGTFIKIYFKLRQEINELNGLVGALKIKSTVTDGLIKKVEELNKDLKERKGILVEKELKIAELEKEITDLENQITVLKHKHDPKFDTLAKEELYTDVLSIINKYPNELQAYIDAHFWLGTGHCSKKESVTIN